MAKYILYIVVAVTVAGCATTVPVKERYESTADIEGITAEERRLWAEARDLDEALHKSEAVYEDAHATRYLQQLMDKLYPDLGGRITVKIVKSPHLNAFALPNGSIYFHLGLLARLENEAQLATVLAHEGAHFVHKHGFKHRETVKNASAFAAVTGALGIPLLGNVALYSSVFGYSRELEREADAIGYERLIKAGYDPRESYRSFEHLAAEAKALDHKEPFFFSSHPKLQERIDSFKELAQKHSGGGRVGTQSFLATTSKARLAALEGDISMNRYKSVLLALGNDAIEKRYGPEAFYYLGEAYRQRADKDDEAQAERYYLRAIQTAPRFAPSYRALGIHYMKQQKYQLSEKYLTKYLELTPHAADRDYIKQYHQTVKRELGTQ